MRTIPKHLLDQVSGGESAAAGAMSASAEVSTWDFGGWGESGGFGSGGSSFGSGDSSLGSGGSSFGSVGIGGFNLGLGGFDSGSVASDVGGAAYSPATVPNGLFGMTIAENLGVGTGILALGSGIGQGIFASSAVEAAGGLGAISGMGAAGTSLGNPVALGVLSAGITGYLAGTALYHNSETVRDVAGWAVENVMNGINSVSNDISQVKGWIDSLPHHPVGQVVP